MIYIQFDCRVRPSKHSRANSGGNSGSRGDGAGGDTLEGSKKTIGGIFATSFGLTRASGAGNSSIDDSGDNPGDSKGDTSSGNTFKGSIEAGGTFVGSFHDEQVAYGGIIDEESVY